MTTADRKVFERIAKIVNAGGSGREVDAEQVEQVALKIETTVSHPVIQEIRTELKKEGHLQ